MCNRLITRIHAYSNVKALTVICAIRDGDQLLICTLEWEPSFKIVLLASGQVQSTRDDGDDTIRQSQALVEFFTVSDHGFKHLPTLFWFGDNKLLDLLKLVDTEETPHITTSGTCFFTETGRVASVTDRELGLGGIEPLLRVEGGDRLFGSCNEVFLVFVGDDLEQRTH